MRARLVEGVRHLGVGIVAGIPVGIVVGGVGGRLAMRVSGFLSGPALQGTLTEAQAPVGAITLNGTAFLILFAGVSTGFLGGALYSVVRPLLAPAGRWRGPVFGAVLLALIGPQIIDPDNFDFRRFGPAVLNVATFAGLFVLFGVAIEPLYARIDAAARSADAGSGRRVVWIVVWVAAAAGSVLIGVAIAVNAIRIVLGQHPPELVLGSMLGAVGVVLVIVTVATGRRDLRRGAAGILLAAVAVGAVRTLMGVARIIAG